MFKEIRPDNVVMYALKHYNNPQGDNEKEFSDDMKRFKYFKRLLRRTFLLNNNKVKYMYGSVVKWISHSTSDARFWVRVLTDPPD